MESESGDAYDAWEDQPSELQALMVLTHVMTNLRDLPAFAHDRSPLALDPYTYTAYAACVESFYVNARLAAEFFVRKPRRDFHAGQYASGWVAPRRAAVELNRVWLMASSHVLHLGRARLSMAPDAWEVEDRSYDGLTRVTRAAHDCLQSFVRGCAEESVWAEQWHDMANGVRPMTKAEWRRMQDHLSTSSSNAHNP